MSNIVSNTLVNGTVDCSELKINGVTQYSAKLPFGTTTGTACEGDDPRLSGSGTSNIVDHAETHVNSDDIQIATASQKGLMSASQASKLDSITDGADSTTSIKISDTGGIVKTATSTTGFGWIIDEDTMISNSATKCPSNQSVYEYTKTKIPNSSSAIQTATINSGPEYELTRKTSGLLILNWTCGDRQGQFGTVSVTHGRLIRDIATEKLCATSLYKDGFSAIQVYVDAVTSEEENESFDFGYVLGEKQVWSYVHTPPSQITVAYLVRMRIQKHTGDITKLLFDGTPKDLRIQWCVV